MSRGNKSQGLDHKHEQTVGGDPSNLYINDENPYGDRVYSTSGRQVHTPNTNSSGAVRIANTSTAVDESTDLTSVNFLPPYIAKYIWQRTA